MIAYLITWKRKPIAQPFVLDVNTAELAAEVSLRLASTPLVYDVKITEIPYVEDKDMHDRLWGRIEARMREYKMYEEAFAFQEAVK